MRRAGFTLIELSIVLVIIGLIVGGVLVGRDLISAAQVRGLVSQIEKYNTSVHTFQTKYGGLPGDLSDPNASGFGFIARGDVRGTGDGNGLIEGFIPGGTACTTPDQGVIEAQGETLAFWEDLSAAKLIEGNFHGMNRFGESVMLDHVPTLWLVGDGTNWAVSDYLPAAKLGNGNFIYAYSGGLDSDGKNYFGLSAIHDVTCFLIQSDKGVSVVQAYNIDNKVDDALPQSGSVTAMYLNGSGRGNGYGNISGERGVWVGANPGDAVTGSESTCYDNGGSGIHHYSTGFANGEHLNCALSFRMQ